MSTATLGNHTIEEVVKAVLAALQSEAEPEQDEPDALVPETAIKTYKEFEDYPNVLRARHVREILDISEAKCGWNPLRIRHSLYLPIFKI